MDKHELSTATWIKSSYSDHDGGNCIEITPVFPAVVPVRDSKTPEGPVLVFPTGGWSAFVSTVQNGHFPSGT
ncbi:DUF397 domain-containing protein [Streptomyces sp. NPDC048506]|uniref:DUF397 domain-containing protein n=1 Tax=Streptomyces sp. NPDC048506 TaxID=3155028 RepID=UPI0034412394